MKKMSSNIVTAISCSGEKFHTTLKHPLRKVNPSDIQSSPIILLVEYPQNDKTPSNFPKESSSVTEEDEVSPRTDSIPYSVLDLGDSVVKEMSYDGNIEVDGVSSKLSSGYGPLLVIRNDDQTEDTTAIDKGSYSDETLLNNFFISPLAKSVVCTVMTKEGKQKESVNATSSSCDIPLDIGVDINEIEKLEDLEGYSSGEDGVQVISDKPVVCRAVATLPANFLYIGITSLKSDQSKGVFAKKEIPRKAQFGPMEGVWCSFDSNIKEDSNLQFTVVKNGEFLRLDVSNENASNWMRYVRPAESVDEQNLSLHQTGKDLYFIATRKIAPGEELKVWYSTAYARARKLPALSNKGRLPRKGVLTNNEISKGKENVLSSTDQDDNSRCKWKCSHCQISFRNATLFNLHVLTHAADNLEINENCDKLSLSPKDSRRYSKKMYDCPICNEIFYKVLHLKEHIHSHAVGGTYYCPHCTKKFKEYKQIRNHIRRFHCGKNFDCPHCSKRFSTSDKLKMHLLSHSERRDFSCASCGKQFKRKDKLSVHMRKKHRSDVEKETPERAPASRPPNCVNQEKALKEYSTYVYKCHICIIGFKRRGMLVNHLAKRHPEVSPESVPELNLPIIKANRDFYCQYCGKIYKSTSKRKTHILKNHPGKKLPLNIRQVSSKSNPDKSGVYSQTIGSFTTNPQGCEWCHKQYASKAKLIQHQRSKHPNKLPKSLLFPQRAGSSNEELELHDSVNEAVDKVTDSEMFLPDPLEFSEYELDGVILDAVSLKRAIKGDVLPGDCSPETLAELGQIIEARPDTYFKVYQGPSGITLAHPVEVWDPLTLCLSPPSETSFIMPPSHVLPSSH